MTIIIIDDDSDDLELMEETILSVNPSNKVISFISPEEGLEKLTTDAKYKPDLIFIDLNMPVISGENCLTTLRNVKEYDSTMIVMYSTTLSKLKSHQLIGNGATYTFEKPSTSKSYFTIVAGILNKSFPLQKHIPDHL